MIPRIITRYDIADHAITQFIEKIKEVTAEEAEEAINRAITNMLSNPDSGPNKQHNGAWYYRYQEEGLAFTLVIRYPTNLGSVLPVVVSVLEPPHTEPDGKRYKPGSELKFVLAELNEEIGRLKNENDELKENQPPLLGGRQTKPVNPSDFDKQDIIEIKARNTELEAQVRKLRIDLLLSQNKVDNTVEIYEARILKLKQHIEMLGEHLTDAKNKYRETILTMQADFKARLEESKTSSNINDLVKTVKALEGRYEKLKTHCEKLTEIANTKGVKIRRLSSDIYRVLKVLEDHPYTTGMSVHAMLEDVMENYKPGYKERRDQMIYQINNNIDPNQIGKEL